MQDTARHCTTLQRTATHCNILQHCNKLQHTATHCKRDLIRLLRICNNGDTCVWERVCVYTSPHWNILQHKTSRCNTPQHTARHCKLRLTPLTLQHIAHTATHCNTLQHIFGTICNKRATRVWMSACIHCTTLSHTATQYKIHSALQHTALHCNTLQHTATHCNALQRRCDTIAPDL